MTKNKGLWLSMKNVGIKGTQIWFEVAKKVSKYFLSHRYLKKF